VSNTMAHNYLQLSLDVVRALVGPENAQLLQVNASQCGGLKMKLLETATRIQDFVDSLSHGPTLVCAILQNSSPGILSGSEGCRGNHTQLL
jgi:hypothetical protein